MGETGLYTNHIAAQTFTCCLKSEVPNSSSWLPILIEVSLSSTSSVSPEP